MSLLAAFGGFAQARAVLARGDDPPEPPGAALRAALGQVWAEWQGRF